MSSSTYLRYPHLHDDLVTFVAENDVWVAPVTGGRAWRVSAAQLPARNPRFSPDGEHILWTVLRGAAPEVVAASSSGDQFRQLTYWGSPTTAVKGFAPNGDAIVTSAFERTDPRHTWAYQVPLDGGPPIEIPWGPVDSVVYGPQVGDERPVLIGSVLTRDPAAWKRYRGGTAGKLWIDADGSGEFSRFAADLDGNIADPMWVGDRIFFLSDHEGYGNLYSMRPGQTDLRRHTDHENFYARHASTDGRRVVFESAGELWLLDSTETEAERIEISLGAASSARIRQNLDVESHLAQVSPNHSGRASIVETHGTLHWLTHQDGPSRTIEATPGVRARLACHLSPDRAAFIADHGGVEAVYIRNVFEPVSLAVAQPTAAPNDQPALVEEPESPLPKPVSAASLTSASHPEAEHLEQNPSPAPSATSNPEDSVAGGGERAATSGQESATGIRPGLLRIELPAATRASALSASPNGALIAVATERGQVLVTQTTGGPWRTMSSTDHGSVAELAFSPDSGWLVWSEPVQSESGRTGIRVTSATEAGPVIELTDGRFRDFSPTFTPDGKYIAFLSDRSFDPMYDTHRFDLSFPSATKPFLLALAASTPSPFGPRIDGTEPEQPAAEATAEATPVEVTIDAERIAERIIAVPVVQGRYSSLRAIKDGLLWLSQQTAGETGDGRASTTDQAPGSRLEKFDFASRGVTTLVPSLERFEISGDGQRIVLVEEGSTVRSVPSATAVESSSSEAAPVDLSRIRVQLDPAKVWEQAFDEAWRLQRDFFWTEDMGGLDWEAMYRRYRPLLNNIGSHDDLVDVLWELQGELGTSHAYVRPRNVGAGAAQQGFLGTEFERTDAGWVVRRILPGESSDPHAVSPLAAAGAAVEPGDILEDIGGVPVPMLEGPGVLLSGAAGKTVELTFRRQGETDDEHVRRRVAVVPLADESRLRYQNWVSGNRRIVREATQGTFGYLHVPDMVASGWAQLHRDLDRETSRDALIVDVRGNRGGHTSQLVAELIGRKVTAWQMPRGEQPSTYPANAPHGPVVVLTDEFAGSDGDIITQVVKLRGIGPVIGTRTWGGVVGIDGKFSLADGTAVTQPRYAFWMTGGVGWSVENHGVDPDIEVPFPPHAYAAGSDPQLEHGVAILREMVAEIPTECPPERSGYASLRLPTLPPRPATSPAAVQEQEQEHEPEQAEPDKRS